MKDYHYHALIRDERDLDCWLVVLGSIQREAGVSEEDWLAEINEITKEGSVYGEVIMESEKSKELDYSNIGKFRSFDSKVNEIIVKPNLEEILEEIYTELI